MTDIYSQDYINKNSAYFWNAPTAIGKKFNTAIKRIFDILAAFVGLLILAPWFILVIILIQRDSPGPAFFRCRRMGKNNIPFSMLKFRTMFERPSSYQGPPITCEGDERITPLGKWLRDTKINELPQLWNVVVGDMSLVGPRPEDVGIAQEWPEDAKKEILSVRPGITSPASILYHDEEHHISRENVMGDYIKNIMPDKMRLDRLYVRNQTFTSDLDIIFWTFAIFIPRIANIEIPEGLLFFGPISRFFHRYFNWFVLDLIISLIAVSATSFLWRLQMPLNWGANNLILFAIGLAVLFSSFNYLRGLNRIEWSWATVQDGINLIFSSSLVMLVILSFNYLEGIFNWLEIPPLPIIMVLVICLLAQIGFVTTRYRFRILTSIASRWLKARNYSVGVAERVLLVGMGDGFKTVVWLLRQEEYRNLFNIIGVVVDDSPNRLGMRVNECLVLGRMAEIPKIVKKYDVGVVIITTSDISLETKAALNHMCDTCDTRIAYVNPIINILNQQITQPNSLSSNVLWAQDQLQYFTVYDSTTGLPNKFLFCEQLRHSLAYAQRYKTITTVVFIQIDHLNGYSKEVSEKKFGNIMDKVAKRILDHKRDSDTLAYLDKGEFGLILENVTTLNDLNLVSDRILTLFSEPIVHDQHQLFLNPKISVWSGSPDRQITRGISNEDMWRLLDCDRKTIHT